VVLVFLIASLVRCLRYTRYKPPGLRVFILPQSLCRRVSQRLEGTRSNQLPHASINKVETTTGSSDKVWNPPTQFSSPRGYCYYRGILSLLSHPKTNQDLQRDKHGHFGFPHLITPVVRQIFLASSSHPSPDRSDTLHFWNQSHTWHLFLVMLPD